jgi:hypothetical protein
MTSALERAMLGRDTSEPEAHPSGAVVEGKVRAVSADGLTFTVPDWDDGKYVFGPAPFIRLVALTTTPTAVADHGVHTHDVAPAPNQPNAGDRCLVMFEGEGVSNPWVIGWWPA